MGSSNLDQVLYYALFCLEGNLKGPFLRGCVNFASASSLHLNYSCVNMIYKQIYKCILYTHIKVRSSYCILPDCLVFFTISHFNCIYVYIYLAHTKIQQGSNNIKQSGSVYCIYTIQVTNSKKH
jgi:hypothetical protein